MNCAKLNKGALSFILRADPNVLSIVKVTRNRKALGSDDFTSTLKKERGRYRLKHSRPAT